MDIKQTNVMAIGVILSIILIALYFIFKKDPESEDDNAEEDVLSLAYLKEHVMKKINDIVDQNVHELIINKREMKKREYQKARLSKSVRTCAQGNIGERDYLKDYIKDLLQSDFGIDEAAIDQVIPFHNPKILTPQDKFEILYAELNREKELRYHAFDMLNKSCGFEMEKYNEYGAYYEVSTEDVNAMYDKLHRPLRYVDKLEVVAQRIYQEVYGNSVADLLRYDTSIDGISGGCSGASSEQYNYMEEVYASGATKKSKTYNSLWIFYRGKAIHLSFLSFASSQDLIRTCKNLYRYGTVGHLNAKVGYKLTYQADGSRVVVVRPNFSTHWAFFLRKFDSTKNMGIEKLLGIAGSEEVIYLLKWIVKGCLNAVLSGDQNSGKTTCLKAMSEFFDRRNPVRTTEQEFELWLNNTYDSMNCLCLRSSEGISVMDAINIQKKMDAAIMLLGEVNSFELAAAYLSLCLSGTKSALCTCHCVSTEDLVDYFRNAVISAGIFKSEISAEEQIANSIHVDIHWEKSPDGKRYISYINEIIPYPREFQENKQIMPLDSIADSLKMISRKRAFYVRPLLVLENGRYVVKNTFSDRSVKRILKNLSAEDIMEFQKALKAG